MLDESMTMRTTLACVMALAATTAAATTGCMVVTTEHRDGLADAGSAGRDGGGGQVDAGPRFDDTCGATDPRMILRDTTRGITIDSRSFRSSVGMSCGAVTPGNDVFIAVDVVAGEYWHFHLSTPDTTRNPMLFLTPGTSCDTRNCEYVSAVCTGSGDEHFAFEANANGRWFIGVDDGMMGGSDYTLEAYRPTCRDGRPEHGEGCDDGNMIDGDGCDRNCRRELSEMAAVEIEPNDNRREANVLRLPASNALTVSGNIGGPGTCVYADTFGVNVPAGASLEVDALNPDGTACASGSLTPFQLSLQNSAGGNVSMNMRDATGCAIVRATGLTAGVYFVRLAVPTETTIAADYNLRIRIVP
jgi:cysteine-rich repeat protein